MPIRDDRLALPDASLARMVQDLIDKIDYMSLGLIGTITDNKLDDFEENTTQHEDVEGTDFSGGRSSSSALSGLVKAS